MDFNLNFSERYRVWVKPAAEIAYFLWLIKYMKKVCGFIDNSYV